MSFDYQHYPISLTNKVLVKDIKAKIEAEKEKNTGSSTQNTNSKNDIDGSLSLLDSKALIANPKLTEYLKEYTQAYINCEHAAQAVFENILSQGDLSAEAINKALEAWKSENANTSEARYNAMKKRIEEAKEKYESEQSQFKEVPKDTLAKDIPPIMTPILPLENYLDKTNPASLLAIWKCGTGKVSESDITDIKKTSDGKITDFYYQGIRYSVRYDENGNITKTIKQGFDDENRINYQQVDNWSDGKIINQTEYKYEYDENGNRIQTSREPHYCGIEGNSDSILSEYFGENIAVYAMVSDVKKTSDGKITDFVWGGVKYSLRYDENGNVVKTIKQNLDENGNVTAQEITNIDENGVAIKENHTYDENGVDNTSEAQQVLNRVRKMYTSKTGDLSISQDSRSKFYAFIENQTIEKLSAAGVSREDILNVFSELFPNVMDYLLNDMGDSETARYLHNKYGIPYPEYTKDAN